MKQFNQLINKNVICFVTEQEAGKEKTYKYEGLFIDSDEDMIEIKDIKNGYMFIPIKKIISVREV